MAPCCLSRFSSLDAFCKHRECSIGEGQLVNIAPNDPEKKCIHCGTAIAYATQVDSLFAEAVKIQRNLDEMNDCNVISECALAVARTHCSECREAQQWRKWYESMVAGYKK